MTNEQKRNVATAALKAQRNKIASLKGQSYKSNSNKFVSNKLRRKKKMSRTTQASRARARGNGNAGKKKISKKLI